MRELIRKICEAYKEGVLLYRIRRSLVYRFYHQIYSPIYKNLPRLPFKIRENKIVFDNHLGKEFGGNPKYIAEELLRRNVKLDLVWITKNPSTIVPDGIRKVRYASLRAYYEFLSAKVWIDNVRCTDRPRKRKGQVYLQTWHGSDAVKIIEKDLEDFILQNDPKATLSSSSYLEVAHYDGEITDAITAAGKQQKELFIRSFWLCKDAEVLEYGLPRNDILIRAKGNLETQMNMRKKIGLPEDKYLVFYAPTFRDDHSVEGYKMDFQAVVAAFSKKLNRDCALVVRIHPEVREQGSLIPCSDIILNETFYPDIQELSIACDTLITDYSSTYYDFLLLEKPVFLFMLDLEEYRSRRPLIKEFYDLPFPKAYSNEELLTIIQSFDRSAYDEKVKDYLQVLGSYDDGKASERTADWILKKMRE